MCLLTVWAWSASESKLLWFDEQLGLAAAAVPHLADIPAALALPVDINPPLHHVLMHWSVGLLGYSATAARLPSLLAMILFLLCLFLFISRRSRPCHGVLAVLLVMVTPVLAYTFEARPYALLLCFTGMALVSYQSRIRANGPASLGIFLCCCAGLLLTHYYGILVIGVFAAGELLRTWERRQFDWQLAVGLVAIPGAVLLLLRGLIRSQWAALKQYHGVNPSPNYVDGYAPYSVQTWIVCLSIVGLAFVLWLRPSADGPADEAAGPDYSSPELLIAACLLALPLLGWIVARATHVYNARYFLPAAAGAAILTCYLVAFVHRRCDGIALMLCLTTEVGVSWVALSSLRQLNDRDADTDFREAIEKVQTPVVFEDAKAYLAAREIDPAFSDHFYYAAEPDLALKVSGTGSDDRLMQNFAKLQPSLQVVRLSDLAARSDTWILVPASYGWLRQCFGKMGNSVEVTPPIRLVQLGTFNLVTIRLPHLDTMAGPWCEAPSR
jgi:hypothetical protein